MRSMKPPDTCILFATSCTIAIPSSRIVQQDAHERRREMHCATTQTQLRHADPSITLKHYQKSIPATVKAAAMALETKLGFDNSEQVLNRQEIQ